MATSPPSWRSPGAVLSAHTNIGDHCKKEHTTRKQNTEREGWASENNLADK